MKALLLQSKPFLPVLDGGNEASRSIVQELLELVETLEIVTFSSEKHPFHEELFRIQPWNQLKIEHFPISLKPEPIQAMIALISGHSYNLSRFTSSAWLDALQRKSKENDWNLIIIDSLFSGQEIESVKTLFPNSKVILRPHNVESAIWKEKAQKSNSFLKKTYLNTLAKQLLKREKEIIRQCDLVLPISDLDEMDLKVLGAKKTILYPYFPPISENTCSGEGNNFFFIGSMNWDPNIEAHSKLVNILLPKIFSKASNVKMKFAGVHQETIRKSNSDQIEYCGFVEDKVDFLKNSGILLAPIEDGSGVRIKIMEALALGVPVVTTVKGAEGIEVRNKQGIFIAKNDEEFVQYALDLRSNKQLRIENAASAIKSMQLWSEKYNLKSIFAPYV